MRGAQPYCYSEIVVILDLHLICFQDQSGVEFVDVVLNVPVNPLYIRYDNLLPRFGFFREVYDQRVKREYHCKCGLIDVPVLVNIIYSPEVN